MPENDKSTISPQALNEWISDNRSFSLIHTLPGVHYLCAHIPGADCACVYEVTFMDQVYAITRDKSAPVVVYGDSNDTMAATVAAEKLQRAGFEKIHILAGGLQLWRELGYALEGSDTEPPEDRGTPARLQAGSYHLDPDSSVIEWTGRNPNTKHFGTLDPAQGHLVVAADSIAGKFKIDMRTIRNVNLEGDELQSVLEAHLNSDDFFFVKLFPSAQFHLKAARQVENATYTLPNYQIDGSLEMRGITAPLSFSANLNQAEDGRITADAHFDFDRTRWGIIYGSSRFFKHLGMHMVYDLISVQLKIGLVPG